MLGFGGLVYTDSMGMAGVTAMYGPAEAAVRAVVAGNDVVLHSPDDVKERELYVSLDDTRIAVLVYGESVTIPITSGPHRIRVHNTLFWKNITFFAKPGQHIRFRTANVPGKSFVMLAIFVGFALMYTVLEREADGPPFGG